MKEEDKDEFLSKLGRCCSLQEHFSKDICMRKPETYRMRALKEMKLEDKDECLIGYNMLRWTHNKTRNQIEQNEFRPRQNLCKQRIRFLVK